jgi:hypothetical protein
LSVLLQAQEFRLSPAAAATASSSSSPSAVTPSAVASPTAAPPGAGAVAAAAVKRREKFGTLFVASIIEVLTKHDGEWLSSVTFDDRLPLKTTTRSIEGILARPKFLTERQLSTSAQFMTAIQKVSGSPQPISFARSDVAELRKLARDRYAVRGRLFVGLVCDALPLFADRPVANAPCRESARDTRNTICIQKAQIYEKEREQEAGRDQRRETRRAEDEKVLPILRRLLPDVQSVTNETLNVYLKTWNSENPTRKQLVSGSREELLRRVLDTNKK